MTLVTRLLGILIDGNQILQNYMPQQIRKYIEKLSFKITSKKSIGIMLIKQKPIKWVQICLRTLMMMNSKLLI